MTTPTDSKRAATGNRSKEDTLRRVRALLSKAEADGVSPAEAESLTAKATELMQRYNIDRAMAEHRERKHVKPTMKLFPVDAPYATAKVTLLANVARGFRCEVLYTGSGTDVEAKVYGFEDDIDMVVILYTSLLLQAASGARKVKDVRQTWDGPVVRTRSARRAYILGFAGPIGRRLQEALAEAKKDDATGTATGKELVLASRELAVKTFVDETVGRVRRVTQVSRNARAYAQGREDGERANLHNRRGVRSDRGALPR